MILIIRREIEYCCMKRGRHIILVGTGVLH
jgi:hypothetical protein